MATVTSTGASSSLNPVNVFCGVSLQGKIICWIQDTDKFNIGRGSDQTKIYPWANWPVPTTEINPLLASKCARAGDHVTPNKVALDAIEKLKAVGSLAELIPKDLKFRFVTIGAMDYITMNPRPGKEENEDKYWGIVTKMNDKGQCFKPWLLPNSRRRAPFPVTTCTAGGPFQNRLGLSILVERCLISIHRGTGNCCHALGCSLSWLLCLRYHCS